MRPVPVVPEVEWVGVLDPKLRIFDVIMQAQQGTTYNSYLVRGSRKTALVEANKGRHRETFLATLREAIDPARIDYLVMNHMEPDHSGTLGDLLDLCPQAQLVCTRSGMLFAEQITNRPLDGRVITDDHVRLDLGGKTLRFFVAPFLHWPDTMFTYLEEDAILFPCDFLGAHYCDERLFNDLVDNYDYAFRYYFQVIFRPFKEYVRQGLAKIEGLPLRLVCPSHGPILRTDIPSHLDRYRRWSEPSPPRAKKRLLVFYASAYGNTEDLAKALAKGAHHAGAETALFDLTGTDLREILEEVEAADGIAVGSCTINGDALPQAWALLSSFDTISLKNKLGAAFGSYGWSGEGPKMLSERLKGLRLRVPEEPFRVQLVPTPADIAACAAYGERLGTAL